MGNFQPVWRCVCFFCWRILIVGVHPDPWGRWTPWAIWLIFWLKQPAIFTTESPSFCDNVISYILKFYILWWHVWTLQYVVFHIFEGCIVHTTTQCTDIRRPHPKRRRRPVREHFENEVDTHVLYPTIWVWECFAVDPHKSPAWHIKLVYDGVVLIVIEPSAPPIQTDFQNRR